LFPSHPVLVAGLAFVSHFVIDAIPYWDYPLHSISVKPGADNRTLKLDCALVLDLTSIGFDACAGLALTLPRYHRCHRARSLRWNGRCKVNQKLDWLFDLQIERLSRQLEIEIVRRPEVKWQLELRKQEGRKLDPRSAEIDNSLFEHLRSLRHLLRLPDDLVYVSKMYFAWAPGSEIWVVDSHLPEMTRKALCDRFAASMACGCQFSVPASPRSCGYPSLREM
jgi:hypothetical protein